MTVCEGSLLPRGGVEPCTELGTRMSLLVFWGRGDDGITVLLVNGRVCG